MKDVRPISGYDPVYGMLLAQLQRTTRMWRFELGKVKPDVVKWQPYPNGPSIGALLLHLADAELYWIEQVALGKTPDPSEEAVFLTHETNQYEGRWPTPPEQPLDWFYGLQDDVRRRTLEAARLFGPPPAEVRREGIPGSSYRRILHHVLEHDAYHGGQAVMLKQMWRYGGFAKFR